MVQHHEPTKAPLKQWNVTVSIVDDGGGHITSLLQTRGVGYHRDGDRLIVSVPALAADDAAARASVTAGALLRGVLVPGVRWEAEVQEVVEPYVEGTDSPDGAQATWTFNEGVEQSDQDPEPADEDDVEEEEEVEEEPPADDALTADELVAELLAALNDGAREWSVSEEQPEGGELAVEHDPEVDGRMFYFTAAGCVGYVAVTEAGLPLVAQREGDNWALTFADVIAGQVEEPKVEEPKVEEPKAPTPPPVAKKTTAAKPKDDSKKDTKRGGRRGGTKK